MFADDGNNANTYRIIIIIIIYKKWIWMWMVTRTRLIPSTLLGTGNAVSKLVESASATKCHVDVNVLDSSAGVLFDSQQSHQLNMYRTEDYNTFIFYMYT